MRRLETNFFMLGTLAAAASLAGFVSVAMAAGPAERVVARGKEILTDKCSKCHAIEKTGDSPLAKAPPFRDLHKNYPIANIAEALAEGIVTGHPDMPSTPFVQDDIDGIIGYIESLNK